MHGTAATFRHSRLKKMFIMLKKKMHIML